MKKAPSVKQLLSSDDCKKFLLLLSNITDFSISVYDSDGALIYSTKENPACEIIKSCSAAGSGCPASCSQSIIESLKLNEPLVYKCPSMIMNFSVPIEYNGEKAAIAGRGTHASYGDFLKFLKIACNRNIQINAPLSFVDAARAKEIAEYIYKSVNCLLNNLKEKTGLTEKLGRFSAVFDTGAFDKFPKNTDITCRYVLDAIEFVIGTTSSAIMLKDSRTSGFKAIYSKGPHKVNLMNINLAFDNQLILRLSSAKPAVLSLALKDISSVAGKFLAEKQIQELESVHIFPIFISGEMEGMIWIFDKELSHENMKIINAFRDHAKVAFENNILRLAIHEKKDEMLDSISNCTEAIASVNEWGSLMETIMDKSTQMLKAEQGSLMLLNFDGSELLVEAKRGIDSILAKEIKIKKGEGIAGKVFETGRPILVQDVENDPRLNQKNKPRYKTKSFLSVPLKIEDRVTGVLNISDKIMGGVFNENDLRLLQPLVTNAAIAIERNQLYKQSEELRKLSITDPLTGVLNRRFLDQRLTEEIARFNRFKQPFSLFMLDIDRFKKYNDTYGHIATDKVLKVLAASITNSLRSIDIAARFGGDEFMVLLPQTRKVDAIHIAERLREQIELSSILQDAELPPNKLTISIGLISCPDDAAADIPAILEKVDQALYLAKKSGGNRLVHL
ncbi:MAG: diguanylate cyclase [Nitrospirae bacterium]|nr:diguanylate cyclase [Nitrospirota bacterium]